MEEKLTQNNKRVSLKEKIELAVDWLQDYVDQGGKVEDLGRKDDLYQFIKRLKIKKEDDTMMLLEEKFAFLGFERKPQRATDAKQALIEAVEKALANGEEFNTCKKRKDLSFYPQLCVYSRTLKNEKSHVEIMQSIGYPQYNDTWYRLREVMDMSEFRDEEGYVDNFRKDIVFNDRLKAAALSYGIPTAIFVQLVLDEKLRKSKIEGDYLDELVKDVQAFAQANGNSLVNFSKKSPALYDKFNKVSHYLYNNFGVELDVNSLLYFFGLEDVEHGIKTKKPISLEERDELLDTLRQREIEKGAPLRKEDLSRKEYDHILKIAVGNEMKISDLFKEANINYQSGETFDRLSILYVKEYPNLDKMKKRRDEILKEKGFIEQNGHCKEVLFEEKVYASIQAYAEFNKEACCLKTNEYGETYEIAPEDYVEKIRNKRKMHREGAKTR